MFTGIIEETGKLRGRSPSGALTDTRIGDSIAVSGVCLTVIENTGSSFTVDVMPETLKSSTLGELRPGASVNLERALQAGGRMGGHMVQGHVDGVGTVRSRRTVGGAVLFEIGVASDVARYTVNKGSVAIDGISLTVVEASSDGFTVSIIPHTLAETTLEGARPGSRLNVEVDIIAKYVEAFLARSGGHGGIENALARGGFILGEGD
jgi:riboflavin synthase